MRSQTFTDSEIVAIAAVAAAALGGVVIGLGRGQDNAVPTRPPAFPSTTGERGRQLAERARVAMRDADLGSRVPEATHAIRTGAMSLAEQIPASNGQRVRRAAESELSRVSERVDPSALRSFLERKVARPLMSRLSELPEALPRDVRPADSLEATIRRAVESATEAVQRPGGTQNGERQEGRAAAIQSAAERARSGIERLGHEVEDRAPAIPTPDLSRAGESAVAAKSRVGGAAQRAVGRSKDFAGETIATTFWLAAASGVVYFLLMSPERREQVKSALCSGFEQLRLLALDLQGYEQEM